MIISFDLPCACKLVCANNLTHTHLCFTIFIYSTLLSLWLCFTMCSCTWWCWDGALGTSIFMSCLSCSPWWGWREGEEHALSLFMLKKSYIHGLSWKFAFSWFWASPKQGCKFVAPINRTLTFNLFSKEKKMFAITQFCVCIYHLSFHPVTPELIGQL